MKIQKGIQLEVKGDGVDVLALHVAGHLGVENILSVAEKIKDGFVINSTDTPQNQRILGLLGAGCQASGLVVQLREIEGRTP